MNGLGPRNHDRIPGLLILVGREFGETVAPSAGLGSISIPWKIRIAVQLRHNGVLRHNLDASGLG
jgi:hypothetical protein